MSGREQRSPDDEAILAALADVGRAIARENAERERTARPLPDAVQARILAHADARGARVVRPARWRRAAAVLAPLALAAAVVLVVLGRGGNRVLPGYALEIGGSQAEMRDPPRGPNRARVVRLGEEAPLVLLARPTERPEAAVEVGVFGERGGTVAPLPADVRVAEEGSARIEIARRALDGVREVRIVLAPRGTEPGELQRRAERGDALGVRIE